MLDRVVEGARHGAVAEFEGNGDDEITVTLGGIENAFTI